MKHLLLVAGLLAGVGLPTALAASGQL